MNEEYDQFEKMESVEIAYQKGAAPENYDPTLIKKTFGRIGFAYVTYLGVMVLLQYFLVGALKKPIFEAMEGLSVTAVSLALYSILFFPTFAVGIPLVKYILSSLPVAEKKDEKLRISELLGYFSMCVTIMVAGGLISSLIAKLIENLTGKVPVNGIAEVIQGLDMTANILFVVIIVPIVEELLFRKFLIDRASRFGKRNAILLSGLMFGLFHVNIYQFFYAAGIGIIFATVYAKTGRLRYSVFMHMVFNFMGAVVSLVIARELTAERLAVLQSGNVALIMEEITPVMLFGAVYILVYLIVAIIGFALIIRALVIRKRVDGAEREERAFVRTYTYFNAGMLTFIILTCLFIALQAVL